MWGRIQKVLCLKYYDIYKNELQTHGQLNKLFQPPGVSAECIVIDINDLSKRCLGKWFTYEFRMNLSCPIAAPDELCHCSTWWVVPLQHLTSCPIAAPDELSHCSTWWVVTLQHLMSCPIAAPDELSYCWFNNCQNIHVFWNLLISLATVNSAHCTS